MANREETRATVDRSPDADAPVRVAPVVDFDATALDPRDRFEYWKERTSTSFELTLPEGVAVSDFRSRVSLWDLGRHLMVVGDYTPMISTRSARLTRADQFDHYSLRMNLLHGGARFEFGDERVLLGAREPVLMDMARPSSFDSPGGPGIVVFVSRAALQEALPRPVDVHGAVPRGAGAQLLVLHLLNLSQRLQALTTEEARSVGSATVSLLAASLLATPATLHEARPAMEQLLMREICRWIASALADPALSAQTICKAFKVSRSTLYRLFESRGGVAHYIKQQRLMRVHAAIAEPERVAQQLVGIAEQFGFVSASHFSREFRRHFGYTPSDARANVLTSGSMLKTSDARAYLASIRSLQG